MSWCSRCCWSIQPPTRRVRPRLRRHQVLHKPLARRRRAPPSTGCRPSARRPPGRIHRRPKRRSQRTPTLRKFAAVKAWAVQSRPVRLGSESRCPAGRADCRSELRIPDRAFPAPEDPPRDESRESITAAAETAITAKAAATSGSRRSRRVRVATGPRSAEPGRGSRSAGGSSRSSKASFLSHRSLIALSSQQPPQPLPAAPQMHPCGRRRDTKPVRHLAHRQIASVVEKHRCPLVGWQLCQGRKQFGELVLFPGGVRGRRWLRCRSIAFASELRCRNSKRDSIQPGHRLLDLVAVGDRPRKRLRDGLVGQLCSPRGERHQGTPQPWRLPPEQFLQPLTRVRSFDRHDFDTPIQSPAAPRRFTARWAMPVRRRRSGIPPTGFEPVLPP